MKNVIHSTRAQLLEQLWTTAPNVHAVLRRAASLSQARDRMFAYLNALERAFYNVGARGPYQHLPGSIKQRAKECIRVLKNTFRTENELVTHTSALRRLHTLALLRPGARIHASQGFLCEYLYLFKGAHGVPVGQLPAHAASDEHDDHAAAVQRSRELDGYARALEQASARYRVGLERGLVAEQRAMKARILRHFDAGNRDWRNARWQLAHIIRDVKTLDALVHLEDDERAGLAAAATFRIPVQITPYYLSLFHHAGRTDWDRAVRSLVIPSVHYCTVVADNRARGADSDFMAEHSTSPIAGVTRRYPQIVILKPFDSCPQLCVYCQRNWEVTSLDQARVRSDALDKAIDWIRRHASITEVLVTGGDPVTLDDRRLGRIIESLAAINHVERIRIGTRVPVTMPCRITGAFVSMLGRHHAPGRREICLVTHVESPRELTPDVRDAVTRIRRAGISVYNQQVFTYYNSRRFETAFLRRKLRLCGIEPYYTFNTKGKDETVDFRVPIARIEQERKEEARLLPGLARTDEPVFNVPRLGKSNLRAWQDHEPIMITPDGRRVYRFFPWESGLAATEEYVYTDVSITDYLRRLAGDGEDVAA
ncbi:KamA family radical SAM protein, partial [bacterium]|nr:KamA family radical SAM protein [bacterium]